MSGNSFGKLFVVTSFGESHGPAIGGIVDGCPPGLPLGEADLKGVARETGETRAVAFRERMNHSRGYAAFDGDHIAAWAWATERARKREGYNPLYYDIDPLPGHVYIYDVFVRPEYRGRGLITALMGCLLEAERIAPGHEHAFMTLDTRNTAMRRVAARYGFDLVGAITLRRVLGKITQDNSGLSAVCKSN